MPHRSCCAVRVHSWSALYDTDAIGTVRIVFLTLGGAALCTAGTQDYTMLMFGASCMFVESHFGPIFLPWLFFGLFPSGGHDPHGNWCLSLR